MDTSPFSNAFGEPGDEAREGRGGNENNTLITHNLHNNTHTATLKLSDHNCGEQDIWSGEHNEKHTERGA